MNKPTVCIVTVTYGAREHLLTQVIERTLAMPQVIKIVVVDNASAPAVAHLSNERVIVLSNQENLGSAGGYYQGIKYAYEQVSCNFVWLLDDDNLPKPNALQILLDEWAAIDAAPKHKAMFCLRNDRATHVKIAKGQNPGRYYLVKNNFLGFHLLRIAYNQFAKFTDKGTSALPFKQRVAMPYVPYGGLLMHRDTITEVGYPEAQLFLYVDDSEYSYRITASGGTIWLVPAATVVDIDQSQGIGYKPRFLHAQILDEWSFRSYYHIRNRMYFYSRVAVTNKLMFGFNKWVYMGWLYFIALASNKTKAYGKLKQAIKDGLAAKLGKADQKFF